jgi:hypothetical protein
MVVGMVLRGRMTACNAVELELEGKKRRKGCMFLIILCWKEVRASIVCPPTLLGLSVRELGCDLYKKIPFELEKSQVET